MSNTDDFDLKTQTFHQPAISLAPGTLLGGKYELLEQIGKGAMGVVWKAKDKVGQRLVALKFVPKEVSRFEAEMVRVRQTFKKVHELQHQAICPTHSLEDGGQLGYYLVMKYLEGESLDAYVLRKASQSETMPLNQVVALLSRVAAALDYAHENDVIHRDIKPANIFLVKSKGKLHVQIIDFGLADEIRTSMTRVSQPAEPTKTEISGTFAYMSPEQMRGRSQSAATDQYALAVVAYELLAGRLPFHGASIAILMRAVLEETPEPIPTISDSANAILRKAMSKDAGDRFRTCRDFINALGTAWTTVANGAPEEEEYDDEDETTSFSLSDIPRWGWAVAGSVLAVAILGMIVWSAGSRSNPDSPVIPAQAGIQTEDAGSVSAPPPQSDGILLGPELLKVTTFKKDYKPSWHKESDWTWDDGQIHGTLSNTSEGLRIVCLSIDPQVSWIPQLCYRHVPLVKDKRYRIEMELRSETDSKATVEVSGHIPKYQSFGNVRWQLEKDWKTYQLQFTAKETHDLVQIAFLHLEQGGVYEIRRVSLREVLSGSEPQPAPRIPAVAGPVIKRPFNGVNFDGWKFSGDKENCWTVGTLKTGVTVLTAEALAAAVQRSTANGYMINLADEKLPPRNKGVNIYTEEKFGDCTIRLEFLLPKEANSGIYLMGEYEVQIADSFGKPNNDNHTLGAIFDIAVPTVNACGEPGTWQSIEIEFVAPKFDTNGNKTADALFKKVVCNGRVVLENVRVQKPTGGGLTGTEAPTGPLMFQGVFYSPVAFRNIEITVPSGNTTPPQPAAYRPPAGITDIHLAAEKGKVEDVRYFVSQGADVNAKNDRGWMPLHSAALSNSNVEVVKYLVSQGADVNARGNADITPLQRAATGNPNVEVLKYLISQGASVNTKNTGGGTPLHDAAINNSVEVVKYLVSQGANVDAWAVNVANTEEKKAILRAAMAGTPVAPSSAVSLFNGRTLAGWVGATDAWRAADGVLYHESRGTIFTSAEYSDFVLTFDFKVEPGGNNGVLLRVPAGEVTKPVPEAIEVQIADRGSAQWEVSGCLWQYLAASSNQLKSGEWNKMSVRYVGTKITIEVNDVVVVDTDLRSADKPGYKNVRGRIGFMGWDGKSAFRNITIQPIEGATTPPQAAAGTTQRQSTATTAPVNQLTDEMKNDGWIAIFDGKTLDGWKSNEAYEGFKVENDAIVGFGARNHLYYMKEEFKNFELKIDAKINSGGNSGVYVKSQWHDAAYPNSGFELQVNSLQHGDGQKTGSLYNIVKIDKALIGDDEWFTYHIICKGNTLECRINGETLYVHTDPNASLPQGVPITEQNRRISQRGHIALQQHPGSTPMFRNIFVKRLPD